MEFLITVAVALFFGLLAPTFLKKGKLPIVTAYIIAGVIIGPYMLGGLDIYGIGFHSCNDFEQYKLITEIALGFIAFTLGSEFRISKLKRIGKKSMIIGIFQAVFTTLLVDTVFICLHYIFPGFISLKAAIVLGAIAAATAPASTLMVIKQYKAKGRVTRILLPVVAIDDAVGLIIFSISFGIATTMQNGSLNITNIIIEPLLEIICSLALGVITGIVLKNLEKRIDLNTKRLSMVICLVLLTVGISMHSFTIFGLNISFSSLLVLMMMGTMFCNACNSSKQIMEQMDKWTAPFIVLFFVISGAELNLSVLGNNIILTIGLVFIFIRCIGKYFGAYISCKMTKSHKKLTKYLGITLFPQEGVALGMSIKASTLIGDGQMIRSIVLLSVLVYGFIGPYLTKRTLIKSGDISYK